MVGRKFRADQLGVEKQPSGPDTSDVNKGTSAVDPPEIPVMQL